MRVDVSANSTFSEKRKRLHDPIEPESVAPEPMSKRRMTHASEKNDAETHAHNNDAYDKDASETHASGYVGFATTAIHAGVHPERWDMHQVVPPISLSTTYKQAQPGEPKGHDYSRAGNPTRDVLETNLAALEGARHARVYSSGLAATAAAASWLHAGDHVVLADDGYGGTQRYFRQVLAVHNAIELSFVDLTQLQALRDALRPNTKMIWFESPSNPLLKIVDIEAVVRVVKVHNPECIVVVDNTFMSPVFQRPLALGADVVLHSLTKYINGHSDVVMGCLVTNSAKLDAHYLFQQLAVGAIPSAFDVYLVIRGIKTLPLRMRQHQENAMAIAHWLESDPRVEKVLYPELPSHPQHAVHKRQTSGMSGMISFYLRTDMAGSRKFLANLKVFMLAESLGGYESLAELPSVMTHASVPPEVRTALGIGDNLIRLSVGCEDKRDLLHDLDAAMRAATGRVRSEREVDARVTNGNGGGMDARVENGSGGRMDARVENGGVHYPVAQQLLRA